MPERIAKFRRTTAPVAREHMGLEVPGNTSSENFGPQAARRKAITAEKEHLPDAEEYAKMAQDSSAPAKSKSKPRDQRRPPRVDGQNQRQASGNTPNAARRRPNDSNNNNTNPRRRNNRDRTPTPRTPEQTFDANAFAESHSFEGVTNAAGEPITSSEELTALRTDLKGYIASRSSSLQASLSSARAEASSHASSNGTSFAATVQRRDAVKAASTPGSVDSDRLIPWGFSRSARYGIRRWENTRYTAHPGTSINAQLHAAKVARAPFSRLMRDPKELVPAGTLSRLKLGGVASGSGTTLANPPGVATADPFASPARTGIEASAGAQTFRHEKLAGEYSKYALSKFKAGTPALAAAKLAVVSNESMSLHERQSALTFVQKIAPRL